MKIITNRVEYLHTGPHTHIDTCAFIRIRIKNKIKRDSKEAIK